MKRPHPILASALAAVALPAAAQSPAPVYPVVASSGEPALPYADVADLVLASPLVVDATVRSTARIRGDEAAGVAPGRTRLYVEADVSALIRGPGAIPPRVGYLLDIALDPRGRVPQLKRGRVLIFARPVAGAAGQAQLVSPAGQQPWTPALDARVRQIAQELVARDAPPIVTGVGGAFHVPGSLPGEGETQVFLTTSDSRPVSLNVLRRPGETARWAVALSEIVDDAAAPPARDTLLWYRLACALPAALPERSTESLSAEDAAVAREDYRFVLQRLGTCERTIPPA